MGQPAPLANDFWMATHDRRDGKPALSPPVLGIGLAASLLCELVMLNWVTVDREQLVLHPQAFHTQYPDDTAQSGVLEMLMKEVTLQEGRHRSGPEIVLPVSDWIAHLQSGPAAQLVEDRLVKAAVVRRETHRPLFRAAQDVYVPVSINDSGWPALRLRIALKEGTALSEQDLTFAGLLLATGMQKSAFADLGGREFEFLAHQTAAAMRAALRALVVCAETAVSRIVMTR